MSPISDKRQRKTSKYRSADAALILGGSVVTQVWNDNILKKYRSLLISTNFYRYSKN